MNWHRWLATPTGLATSRPKFGGDAICRSTSVASFWTRELRHSVQRALPLLVGRDRKFADSLLEGTGFEIPVPRNRRTDWKAPPCHGARR